MAQKLTNNRTDELLANRTITRVGDIATFHKFTLWRCTNCGHEWLATPNNVINRNTGCPTCRLVATRERNKQNTLSTDCFINKANAVHNNVYDYSNVVYVTSRKCVRIMCSLHGAFNQTPNSHLGGSGCPECGRIKTQRANTTKATKARLEFTEKASRVHNNVYDYSNVVYVNNRTCVDICCGIHGTFRQAPTKHLAGTGCPDCSNARMNGHYTERYFEKYPQDVTKPAFLYVVELSDVDGTRFVKVGITAGKTAKPRLTAYSNKTARVLLTIGGITLYNAFKFEQLVLLKYADYAYTPAVRFGGHTECLAYTHLNEYLQFIGEMRNEYETAPHSHN